MIVASTPAHCKDYPNIYIILNGVFFSNTFGIILHIWRKKTQGTKAYSSSPLTWYAYLLYLYDVEMWIGDGWGDIIINQTVITFQRKALKVHRKPLFKKVPRYHISGAVKHSFSSSSSSKRVDRRPGVGEVLECDGFPLVQISQLGSSVSREFNLIKILEHGVHAQCVSCLVMTRIPLFIERRGAEDGLSVQSESKNRCTLLTCLGSEARLPLGFALARWRPSRDRRPAKQIGAFPWLISVKRGWGGGGDPHGCLQCLFYFFKSSFANTVHNQPSRSRRSISFGLVTCVSGR